MSRYVLVYRDTEPDPEDLKRIAAAPGVTVVDHTGTRAMLLEASDKAINALRNQLGGWTIAPQTTYPPPLPAFERVTKRKP